MLYSVMLECKATQGSENMSARDVKAAPSPQCVLFFDWQLQDMRRFLTNNKNFGKFLQWYSASGNTPNISILAMQGLPSGRGHKGGQAK